MDELILALNVGSSSIKMQAATSAEVGRPLFAARIDRIGVGQGTLELVLPGRTKRRQATTARDHAAALEICADALTHALPGRRIAAVGHRIVHGGPDLAAPVAVDDALMEQLDALVPLAPLHQPHSLGGIRLARALYPQALQVACFDTGFHLGKPREQDSFALPRRYYDAGLRRYGFHGLSCQSVLRSLGAAGEDVATLRLVIAHLGNGCSVTAVAGGRSQSNSMGFSTLDGVAMSTRCGRIDPGVLLYLLRGGMTPGELETLLYTQSGLLGLSGLSSDIRDLLASDRAEAAEAVIFFVARVAEEIARAAAVLGGIDLVVFCGGIGENAASIREGVQGRLKFLSAGDRGPRFTVVETREETEILLATDALLRAAANPAG